VLNGSLGELFTSQRYGSAMSTLLAPGIFRGNSMRFQGAIEQLSLKSGLQVCLDASDVRSYAGSGQTWADTSGNGRDFFVGATVSAEASDPTFTGTAGEVTAYWQGDGGDYFRKASANDTFINSLHKNNAIFSCAAWIYLSDNTTSNYPIFGTNGTAGSSVGATFRWAAADSLTLQASSGSGNIMALSHGSPVPQGVWSFVAASINEATGAGGLLIAINDDIDTFTSTYSSPSASNATYTMEVGAGGNAVVPMVSGSRMACFAMWDVALTSTQLGRLFNRTRGRFGV